MQERASAVVRVWGEMVVKSRVMSLARKILLDGEFAPGVYNL
jgi:hypothetical protein